MGNSSPDFSTDSNFCRNPTGLAVPPARTMGSGLSTLGSFPDARKFHAKPVNQRLQHILVENVHGS